MFGLGQIELFIIAVIVIVLFRRLPEVTRSLERGLIRGQGILPPRRFDPDAETSRVAVGIGIMILVAIIALSMWIGNR